jgi:F-type H+-transporting ATPase subunit gamma
MATIRELRTRIKSVKSTQQVTKAMKMVAAAKLRRAQERAIAARPYSYKLKEILASVARRVDVSAYPALSSRKELKRVLVVIVSADRGLCGAFNSNIIKLGRETIETEYSAYSQAGNAKVMTVGRRSSDFFAKLTYPIVEAFPNVFNKLDFSSAKAIAEKAASLYMSGEVDKVVFVYNEFKSVLAPTLRVETFLPITPPATKPTDAAGDYIFEPAPDEIINQLVPLYLANQVWRIMLESNAAEQAARMTAMESASDNAKEIIRTLSISYNRARQAAITKEIIEIVSGANALQTEE